MPLSNQILSFLQNVHLNFELPHNIEVLNSFNNAETKRACDLFYKKFYNGDQQRCCIIGINPGRFGAGVTGVPFTDPIRLESELGIENTWPKKQELSSVFVYDMIHAFGGAEEFYAKFYITAVSPLGFTRNGKNLNYYDDKVLMEAIKPFAADCLQKQLSWGLNTSAAFCLGEGANYKFLSKLNAEHKFFDKIIPLSHPRFIMQYKLKKKEEYIQKYLEAFAAVSR